MKTLWRWIRYGSIGTFAAGILTVIQACTPEREGLGLLVLLLALNMCTGDVDEQHDITDAQLAALYLIDDFSVTLDRVASLGGCNFAGQMNTHKSLPFGSREIVGGVGDGSVTVSTYFGRLSSTMSGAGCDHAFSLAYPSMSGTGVSIDLSAYTRLKVMTDMDNISNPTPTPDLRVMLFCEGGGYGQFQLDNMGKTNGFKQMLDDAPMFFAPCTDLTKVNRIEVQLRNVADGDRIQIRSIHLAQ